MSLLEDLGCGVVMVSYRSHHLVAAGLRAMPWLDSRMTVVVDNSADAIFLDALQELLSTTGCAVVSDGTNPGFGAGCNAGIAALPADATTVLLLNPDASIDEQSLRVLVDAAHSDPGGLHGPVIMRPDGRVWFDGGTVGKRWGVAYHDQEGRDWLSGACLVARRATFNHLGGFDARYFLYWEDVDLGRRWAQAGRLNIVHGAIATHDPGGTQQSSGPKSLTYVEHTCRGRILFMRTHLGSWDRVRWMIASPAYAWQQALRTRPEGRVPGFSAVVAGVRGTLSGLRAPSSAPSNGFPCAT